MILFMNCELYSTNLCLSYASFVLNFTFFVKVTSLLIIWVHWGFPGDSMVKNLPAILETQVWSLDWEDPLEKGMAAHSSLLSWEFHGQRRLMGYSPQGHKELDTAEQLTLHTPHVLNLSVILSEELWELLFSYFFLKIVLNLIEI